MNKCRNTTGQSMIEFTFTVVVIMFIVWGMVQIFRWAGLDLANRRLMQDTDLTTGTTPNAQLNPYGDVMVPMGVVYHGTFTNAT